MPRIRTMKPEMFSSPQVMNVSIAARLLFVGLISQADDEGWGSADPRKLRSTIFPGDEDINTVRVDALLAELAAQKLISLTVSAEHGALYYLPTWKRHQSIDRPRPSIYRAGVSGPPEPTSPTTQNGQSSNARRTLVENTSQAREGSDLKDRKDLKDLLRARERTLRARAPVDKSREELESDAKKLAQSGLTAPDIAKALKQYRVEQADVEQWLAA